MQFTLLTITGFAALAVAAPAPSNNAACYLASNSLLCPQGGARLMPRDAEVPTACYLNEKAVNCGDLHKRTELLDRSVAPACTRQLDGAVHCSTTTKRDVELEAREAGTACTKDKTSGAVVCGQKLKTREAELETREASTACTKSDNGAVVCQKLKARGIEVEEREANSACIKDTTTGGVVCGKLLKERALDIEEREAGSACTKDKTSGAVVCGQKLKARDAEPVAVPVCMMDGPCEPTVGNSNHLHSMVSTSTETN